MHVVLTPPVVYPVSSLCTTISITQQAREKLSLDPIKGDEMEGRKVGHERERPGREKGRFSKFERKQRLAQVYTRGSRKKCVWYKLGSRVGRLGREWISLKGDEFLSRAKTGKKSELYLAK